MKIELRRQVNQLTNNQIFEIPKDKSADFIKQFNKAKVSDEFIEECRMLALKTGKKNKNLK